jgi:hypothetical protein
MVNKGSASGGLDANIGSDYCNKRVTGVSRVAGDEVTSLVFVGDFRIMKGRHC